MSEMVRIDTWGGENSNEHIARQHVRFGTHLIHAICDLGLSQGYLVNLRVLKEGEGWGPNEDFDLRAHAAKGHA